VLERHCIPFYKDKMEAGHVLEDYLLDPPQLKDIKQRVMRREIVFPVESKVFGKLIHNTFRVELDMQTILAHYRNATETFFREGHLDVAALNTLQNKLFKSV
jgi:hypothetical protein